MLRRRHAVDEIVRRGGGVWQRRRQRRRAANLEEDVRYERKIAVFVRVATRGVTDFVLPDLWQRDLHRTRGNRAARGAAHLRRAVALLAPRGQEDEPVALADKLTLDGTGKGLVMRGEG